MTSYKINDTAYIFGNGPSRVGFDISSLRGHGRTIGCNWAYKEYPFDIIASMDHDVSAAISKEWAGLWIRRDHKQFIDKVYLNYYNTFIGDLPQLTNGLGWDAGRTAMWAIDQYFSPKTIFLFGFDISSDNKKPNVEGWNSLLSKIKARVIMVGPKDLRLNLEIITYDEFRTQYGIRES